MKFGSVFSVVFLCLFLSSSAWAGPTDIPRVLCVGDSWPGFMQILRSFDVTIADYPQLAGYGQRGSRTCEVGVMADEFDTAKYLDVVREELETYPTIDIVHLSLGGNDFLNRSNWTPSMSSDELNAFIATVNAHMESVIDYILAIRPNIRVAICGYDFVHHTIGSATAPQINAVWAQYEQTKLALAQSKSRVFYVHNLGLMQYHFGIQEASPEILPYHVPAPGGYAQNYVPFPGGDPNYFTPLKALMDKDIHLSMAGYDILAKRCIDEFYGEWMSWPVVLEILPLGKKTKSSSASFRVSFSQEVTGVDVSDFSCTGGTVASVTGSGATYTVTANLARKAGAAQLSVLDDDSIKDASDRVLGGPGTGNGGFDHDGSIAYADPALASPEDFDGAMTALDNSLKPVAWMFDYQPFTPDACDVNGGTISVNPPGINGNGMLDACELGVITACLENANLDCSATGGITHAAVVTAWQHNYARMHSDLGGDNNRFCKMIPGVDTMLAGMMTLGDSGSAVLPGLLIGSVSAFIQLPSGTSIPSTANYTPLGAYFGPNGDADGDGYTNRQEYDYFYALGGKAMYIAAALDPGMIPESNCGNNAGGTYNPGAAFCVSVSGSPDLTGGFEWRKDGLPLSNDAVISGSHWRELHINALRISDSGDYTCVYENGAKTFGPITITVREQKVPAAGSTALIVLAGLLASTAVYRLRRNVASSRTR